MHDLLRLTRTWVGQLESIGQCLSLPPADLYAETTTNSSAKSDSKSSSAAADGSKNPSGAIPRSVASLSVVGAAALLAANLL